MIRIQMDGLATITMPAKDADANHTQPIFDLAGVCPKGLHGGTWLSLFHLGFGKFLGTSILSCSIPESAPMQPYVATHQKLKRPSLRLL